MNQYALFTGKKQISKAHSTKEAVEIEAFEQKLVIDYSADFIGDQSGRHLADGYSIRELPSLPDSASDPYGDVSYCCISSRNGKAITPLLPINHTEGDL